MTERWVGLKAIETRKVFPFLSDNKCLFLFFFQRVQPVCPGCFGFVVQKLQQYFFSLSVEADSGEKLFFVRQQTVKAAGGKRKEDSWPPIL